MALVKMNWQPTLRQLRQFGMLVLPIVCGFLAFSAQRKWHQPNAVIAFCSLAVVSFLIGLVQPRLLRGLFVGLSLITFPIGWVMSYVVLTLLFCAVFVPAAAIMKLFGHDPMARKLDRSAASYWIVRKDKSQVSRYFKQF
jgi:hypothetical protein